MSAERLQKIIAAAGIASRRKAEELITGGRVTVNGEVVTTLGSKADPATDHISVNGKLLQGPERKIYLLLNKPRGYVSTVSDPEGRATVMDLVRKIGARVFPIGRLDYNSEGLLLLTNDGELAQHLTHASYHVPKTYLVKVSGKPTDEAIARLRAGVTIHEDQGSRSRQVRTSPAKIELLKDATNPWYEITLVEGRNRQIHRMFEKVGHHVEKIKRVRYGPLELDVEPGEFRELTLREVHTLQTASAKQQERSESAVTASLERASEQFKAPRDERPERKPRQPGFAARRESPGRGERKNRPQRTFGSPSEERKQQGWKPRSDGKPKFAGGRKDDSRSGPREPRGSREDRPWREKQDRPGGEKRERFSGPRPEGRGGPKRFAGPRSERPGGARRERPESAGRPRFDKPGRPNRSRPAGDRRERPFGQRQGGAAGPSRNTSAGGPGRGGSGAKRDGGGFRGPRRDAPGGGRNRGGGKPGRSGPRRDRG